MDGVCGQCLAWAQYTHGILGQPTNQPTNQTTHPHPHKNLNTHTHFLWPWAWRETALQPWPVYSRLGGSLCTFHETVIKSWACWNCCGATICCVVVNAIMVSFAIFYVFSGTRSMQYRQRQQFHCFDALLFSCVVGELHICIPPSQQHGPRINNAISWIGGVQVSREAGFGIFHGDLPCSIAPSDSWLMDWL